jgi:hypothetical protein
MDFRELQEIRRILRSHEELNQCNRNSTFSVTSKVHDNGHQSISQFASIMGTLQQKQQIATLEAECSLFRNMVVNLRKDAQLGASNQRMSMSSRRGELKEEDIVHQLIKDMEIGTRNLSQPT